MRAIKFRAWDGEFMLDRLNTVTLEDIEIGVVWEGDDISDQKKAVFMQFTGLLDKNGKEIYEGDILQFQNDMVNMIDVMRWDDERNGWEIFEPLHRFEVIGNIHENPELLEEKK